MDLIIELKNAVDLGDGKKGLFYAKHRNKIDLSCTYIIGTKECISNVKFTLSSSPVIFIECIGHGNSQTSIGLPTSVEWETRPLLGDNAYLDVERESEITFKAEIDTRVLVKRIEVVLLPKYYCCTGGDYLKYLVSFVTPNAGCIKDKHHRVSDYLKESGKEGRLCAFDYYKEKKDYLRREGIKYIAYAAFTVMEEQNVVSGGLEFDCRPDLGQCIRPCSEVFNNGIAVCIDITITYASLLESLEINPVLFIIGSHAFVGFWLVRDYPESGIIHDKEKIRHWIESNVLVAVNSSSILNHSEKKKGFDDACEVAKNMIQDAINNGTQITVLNIRRLQKDCGDPIKPIPVENGGFDSIAPIEKCESSGKGHAPDAMPYDEKDLKRNVKTADWMKDLLDTSCGNDLIHMKSKSSTNPKVVFLLMDEVVGFWSQLKNIDEMPFTIKSKPDGWVAGKNTSPFERTYMGEYKKQVGSDLESHLLRTSFSDGELNVVLASIYDNACKMEEERGCNSLFIALGVLEWYDKNEPNKPKYAPLVLVPAEMNKNQKGYHVCRRDEEPFFNVTLLEKLRLEYSIDICLDNLPKGDDGIDLERILVTVRDNTSVYEGWRVLSGATLGVFSFSNHVIWNDLDCNIGRYRERKVVNCILEKELFPIGGGLEDDCDSTGLCLTMPADGSQINAINALATGRSFILQGPPGTGKSQTIANMICNELYCGRTVLFVAEKRVALDVVHKCLKGAGVEEYCLELHSNKTTINGIKKQLMKVAKGDDTPSNPSNTEELQQIKNELDDYADELHNKKRDWGLSLYEAICRYTSYECDNCYEVSISDEALERMKDLRIKDVEDLVGGAHDAYNSIKEVLDDPVMRDFKLSSWTSSIRKDVRDAVSGLKDAKKNMDDVRDIIRSKGCSADPLTPDDMREYITGLQQDHSEKEAIEETTLKVPEHVMEFVSRISGAFSHSSSPFEIEGFHHSSSVFTLDSEFGFDSTEEICLELYNVCKRTWGSSPQYFPLLEVIKQIPKLENTLKKLNADPDMASVLFVWKPEVLRRGRSRDLIRQWEKANSSLLNKKTKRDEFFMLNCNLIRKPSTKHVSEGSPVGALIKIGPSIEALNRIVSSKSYEAVYDSWENIKENLPEIHRKVVFHRCYRIYKTRPNQSCDHLKELDDLMNRFTTVERELKESFIIFKKQTDFRGMLEYASCDKVCESFERNDRHLHDLIRWNQYTQKLEGSNLQTVVDHIKKHERNEAIESVLHSLYCNAIESCIKKTKTLNRFNKHEFEKKIDMFRGASQRDLEANKGRLKHALSNRVNETLKSGERDVSKLYSELYATRTTKSVRRFLDDHSRVLTRFCPCFLMSPLSVAQYITEGFPLFDTVIFDESSQIPLSKAIGSLGRAVNAVVVGDDKQLPPSKYFQNANDPIDGYGGRCFDSFMSKALSIKLPELELKWHYRSKHESLIAFNNRMFYENSMFTIPSACKKEDRVRFEYIENGKYEGGENDNEANAIVEELHKRITGCGSAESIGVIALNVLQQRNIQKKWEDWVKDHPELNGIIEQMSEPIFIKNLENVQGDERDVIMISIGHGLKPDGKLSYNFGPLNRDDGWKRLNVATSRARSEMLVFSSIKSSDVHKKTGSIGMLRKFLEYAESGAIMHDSYNKSSTSANSIIAVMIRDELKNRGYCADLGIGYSNVRVDVAVSDPRVEGEYILGILIDGECYKNALNAWDRDCAHSELLIGHGWRNIMKIWSIEWYYDRDLVLERIVEFMDRIRGRQPALPDYTLDADSALQPDRC